LGHGPILPVLALAAALVFAVRERHHEAAVCCASILELPVFAFVLLALLGPF
jgi:hypothetical protein